MGIKHLDEAKKLRRCFEVLGKEGIAKRAIEICKRVAESENCKDSIKACGEMHALFIACKEDHYWMEKSVLGYQSEYLNQVWACLKDQG